VLGITFMNSSLDYRAVSTWKSDVQGLTERPMLGTRGVQESSVPSRVLNIGREAAR